MKILLTLYLISSFISWIILIGWTYSWNQGHYQNIAKNEKIFDIVFSIFWSLFVCLMWPIFIPYIYYNTEHVKYGWFSRDIKLRKIKNEEGKSSS